MFSGLLKFFIVLFYVVINTCVFSDTVLERTKRFLVYPQGGTYKLVVGIAIPVKLGLKQSLSCAVNFQYQYAAPQNISQLQSYPPIIGRSREKRDGYINSDRAVAYLGIEAALNRYGVNGHECLLRSICENAMQSVFHRANGIYGQLLHILLTPDYGDYEYDEDLDQSYIDAQKAGLYGVDCFSLYPSCQRGTGIFDFISIFD